MPPEHSSPCHPFQCHGGSRSGSMQFAFAVASQDVIVCVCVLRFFPRLTSVISSATTQSHPGKGVRPVCFVARASIDRTVSICHSSNMKHASSIHRNLHLCSLNDNKLFDCKSYPLKGDWPPRVHPCEQASHGWTSLQDTMWCVKISLINSLSLQKQRGS